MWRPILEKIPLLAIACLFCLLAVRGQEAGALEVNREYPFAWRIANAIISYVVYLGQFFCPVNLVPYYPRRPLSLPPWQVAAAILALAFITLAALWQRRQRPYLLVGWLWYVGMIFPVIGLVQFGAQAEADRFTYLPQIGLAIAIVWTWAEGKRGAGGLCREGPAAVAERDARLSYQSRLSPFSAYCFRAAAAVCVMLLVVSAWRQTRHWRDTEALWTHTVACSPENTLAMNDLGVLLAERGAVDAAIAQYQRALQIRPDFPKAHNNLGDALVRRGRTDEAIQHYQRALETQPNFAEAHNNLGIALARRGRTNEAIAHFQQAVRAKPDLVDARYDLGVALQEHGEIDAAIAQLQKVLELKPDFAEAHDSLGVALARRGRIARQSPSSRRPWRSSPSWPRPTTTWELFWPGADGPARRSCDFGHGPGVQARTGRGPSQPGHRLDEPRTDRPAPRIGRRPCGRRPTSPSRRAGRGREKGTGAICAQHPPGRSGMRRAVPFSQNP